MNPVELMLLTVLANAIVTGIIVYLIQKRIERSYTMQMEEFKANLQYSNFEQQTKYKEIYTKRVKALEDIFQKFAAYKTALQRFAIDTKQHIRSKKKYEPSEYEALRDDVMTKLRDFKDFYEKSRLFLSDDAHELIIETLVVVIPLQLVILEIARDLLIITVPDMLVNFLVWLEDIVKFEDVDLNNPKVLLDTLSAELSRLAAELEVLYETEAGAVDK